MFSDSSTLGAVADILEGRIRSQNDLDKLEKWFKISWRKISRNTCKVLHLAQNNQMNKYNLGIYQLSGSTAENDLELTVDQKLIMSQEYTLVVKKSLYNAEMY